MPRGGDCGDSGGLRFFMRRNQYRARQVAVRGLCATPIVTCTFRALMVNVY
jgi:hypothetical protein